MTVKPLPRRYYVEYISGFFGEREQVKEFTNEAAAKAFAAELQRQSDATDDPEDCISYVVGSYIPAPINPSGCAPAQTDTAPVCTCETRMPICPIHNPFNAAHAAADGFFGDGDE